MNLNHVVMLMAEEQLPLPVASEAMTNFGTAVSTVLTHFRTMVGTIKGEPILLLPFGVAFISAIITIARKLLRFGRR